MNTSNHDREPLPDEMDEALHTIFQSPAPNEVFVDRLEQQLRDRAAALSDRGLDRRSARRSRLNLFRRFNMLWPRSRGMIFNVVGLAALLIFTISLIALFSHVKSSTTAPGTPTPTGPLLMLGGSIAESLGPVGQRTIPVSVRAALPQIPDRVPLYDIKAVFDQPTPELARRWAEQLGLTAVRLYQDSSMPETTYIAQGEDGRSVRVGAGAQLIYQMNVESMFVPTRSSSTLDPHAAQAAAEAFLNSIADLVVIDGNSTTQITFRVEPSPQQAAETRTFGMTFEYSVLIDGLPVLARGMPGTITVDAEGRIRSAMLTSLRITPTGSEVAVQPVDTVVRSFLNGDQSILRGSGWSSPPPASSTTGQQPVFREPVYTVGESVVMLGYIQHWVAADGGPDQYLLSPAATQSFLLEGNGLNDSGPYVEVRGRVGEQIRAGLWRLQVTSIQPGDSSDLALTWMGVIRRQSDGTWLETDGGNKYPSRKYRLPDVPAEVTDGEYVVVSGVLIESDANARLEWQMIAPYSPTQPATTSAGSGTVSAVERQVVVLEPTIVPPIEPTQVMTASEVRATLTPVPAVAVPNVYPNGAPYSTGIFQSVTSGMNGPAITPTLPAWWTYKSGDDVTLEGLLSAQGYRILSTSPSDPSATPVPGQILLEAYLLVTKDEDKPDEMVPLTLVGDQVNLDLIRLSGLHVRVQGRLLNSDEAMKRYPNSTDKGLTGLTLEVTHFEKAWPDETKDVYSGHIRIETLDGREAAIFSDTLSSQDYVLADSLTYTYTLEMDRQRAKNGETVQAIGVVVAGKTFASRPMLRLLETQSGTNMPEASLQALRAKLDNPIQDIGPAPEGPQDVIIDRIELAYVFQPLLHAPAGFTSPPTELVYELTGHSSDGRYTVTYDLAATAPASSAAPTIEPLVPPLVITPASTDPASSDANTRLHLPWTADVTRCVTQDGASHGTDRHEIDFDLDMEPVWAARAGTVIMADWDSTDAGGGYVIKIQHDDGSIAVYQHLSRVDVKKDDRVAQGQPIGVSGSTGKVTGPRLAFALLKDSVEIPAIFAEVGHELKTGECVVSQNR